MKLQIKIISKLKYKLYTIKMSNTLGKWLINIVT